MTLLMTADAVGGVWTYALDLARELGERGHRVHLATMGPPPSAAKRADAGEIPGLTLHVGEYRLEWEPEPWDDLDRAGAWLLALFQEIRPDAVHLNGFVHAALPWPVPPLVVAHSDVRSWWRAVRGGPAPAEWDRYTREVGEGLRKAGRLAAPTRAMADDLVREYALTRPVEVVPNFRDPALYAPGAKTATILGVGRLWDEAKNAATLARVAADLPWPVRLAGDGGEGLPNVTALGHVPSEILRGEYARAAIYAHPARYEPFGLSVLEAAMSGCALVLGDIPSLRENWDGAALFAAPDDELALGAALTALIEDAALRARMGEAARERAREFSAARTVGAYLSLYPQAVPA